jgi:hypothetical protein
MNNFDKAANYTSNIIDINNKRGMFARQVSDIQPWIAPIIVDIVAMEGEAAEKGEVVKAEIMNTPVAAVVDAAEVSMAVAIKGAAVEEVWR